jgi:hypothetical protein
MGRLRDKQGHQAKTDSDTGQEAVHAHGAFGVLHNCAQTVNIMKNQQLLRAD